MICQKDLKYQDDKLTVRNNAAISSKLIKKMKTLFAILYVSTAQEHKQLALLAPPIANSTYTFFSVAAVCIK